jgi:hypothetical protein
MLGLDLLGRVVWLGEASRISGIDPGLMEFEMVTAPARPLVHAYLGDGDPMEIVDSPFGRMEREKARAMATGEFSGLVDLSKKIRNDSAAIAAKHDERERELQARADAISARERQHAVSVARFTDFVGKAAVLFDRIEKARADQEREPIAHPPGHPSAQEDDAPAHTPGGELHVIEAKDPDDGEAELADDSIPGKVSVTDGDFLRLKHPIATDQAEFPEGEELPTPPEFKAPAGDHED